MREILSKLLQYPYVKVIIAEVFIFLSWTFDGGTHILAVVYTLILIDTVTGIIIAAKNKEISSKGFFRSPKKCLVYFTMLIVSRLVDKSLPLKIASPIMDAFLVTTEAVSILENLSKLGYPVPTFLVNKLKTFYEQKQLETK